MAWTNFAALTSPTLPALDADLTYLSSMTTIPCTIVGTNSITMTTSVNIPTISTLTTGMLFGGIIAANNTGAVTITLNAFSAVNVYKPTQTGPALLTGGELIAGNTIIVSYNSALNSGAGGFMIITTVQPLGIAVAALGCGFINKFRNATFDIWQRGTAVTVTAGGSQYTADGWIVGATSANATVTQATGRLLSNYCMQITGASSMTNTYWKQRIGARTAAPLTSQTVTAQGWVYNNTGSAITPTLTIKHASARNDFSAPVTDVNSVAMLSCANGAWTQIGYTFLANSLTGNGLEFILDFGATLNSSSNYVRVAEWDIRSTPGWALNTTPYFFFTPEMRLVPVEWNICQEYLPGFNAYPTQVQWGPMALGGSTTPSTAGVMFEYFSNARGLPTSIIITGAANTFSLVNMACTQTVNLAALPVFTSSSGRAAFVTCSVASGLVAQAPYYLTPNVSTSNILFGGSEL